MNHIDEYTSIEDNSSRFFVCQHNFNTSILTQTHGDITHYISDDSGHEGYHKKLDIGNWGKKLQPRSLPISFEEIETTLQDSLTNKRNCYIGGVFFPKSVVTEILKNVDELERIKAIQKVENTIGKYDNYIDSILEFANFWKTKIEERKGENFLFSGKPENLSIIRITHILFETQEQKGAGFQRKILREIIFHQESSFREFYVGEASDIDKHARNIKLRLAKTLGMKGNIISRKLQQEIEEFLGNYGDNTKHRNEIQNMYEWYCDIQVWRILSYVRKQYKSWYQAGGEFEKRKNNTEKRRLWGDNSFSLHNPKDDIKSYICDLIRFQESFGTHKKNISSISLEEISDYHNKQAFFDTIGSLEGGVLFPRMLFDYTSAIQQRKNLKGMYDIGDTKINNLLHIDGVFRGSDKNDFFGIQVYTGPGNKVSSINNSKQKLFRKQTSIDTSKKRKENFKVWDTNGDLIEEIMQSKIPSKLVLVHTEFTQQDRYEMHEYLEQYNTTEEKHIFTDWNNDNIAIQSKHIGNALNYILSLFSTTGKQQDRNKLLTSGISKNGIQMRATKKQDILEIHINAGGIQIGIISLMFNTDGYFSKKPGKIQQKPSQQELQKKKIQKQKRAERRKKHEANGRRGKGRGI